jgi:hypothetical protein
MRGPASQRADCPRCFHGCTGLRRLSDGVAAALPPRTESKGPPSFQFHCGGHSSNTRVRCRIVSLIGGLGLTGAALPL